MVELSLRNFEKTVVDNTIVFIDMWAPWCSPCRRFASVFAGAAQNNPDMTFAKVNTDEQSELAALLQIRAVPTLMAFREQVLLFAEPGVLSPQAFNELIHRVRTIDMDKVRRCVSAAALDA